MTLESLSLAVLAVIASATPALAICDPKIESPTSTARYEIKGDDITDKRTGLTWARTPISRYEIKGDEVTDKKTGLTWARCSVGQHWQDTKGCVGVVQELSWLDAKSEAGNGWRLPTKDELGTLTTPTCRHPAVNEEVFPTMNPEKLAYWSSTPFGSNYAVAVHFADINNSYGLYSGRLLAVRLVKDTPKR